MIIKRKIADYFVELEDLKLETMKFKVLRDSMTVIPNH